MHIRSMSKAPSKAALPTEVADTQQIIALLDALFKAIVDGNSVLNIFKNL
ncbi:MAG: hypothetical protein NTU83_08780 [Candidatus Hydrogenedentes bacterium]|nr:hypothetical protein [Candidatus Hydrogenedentota bacterium]